MSFQYAFLDPFAYFDTPRGNLAPHPLPGSHPGPTGNPKEGLDVNPFSSINFFNTPLQLGYEESARLDSSDSKATEVNSFSHALVMYQRDAPVYALDLEGQGTISVSASAAAELCICISSADRSHPSLYLDITPTSCTFSYGYYTSATMIPARPPPDSPYVGTGGGAGSGPGMYLDVNRQTTYWMSIDCPNGILKYGKGYLSSNLTLLEARLKKMDDHGRIVWPETWTFLEKLSEVRVLQTGGDMHALSVATQTLPLVDAPSPYVIPDYRISMNDLESNNFTVVANLPVECQKLYANVAGPNIVLNTPDFPAFGRAIERSVSTEGCLGYSLLMRKAGEFGGKKGTKVHGGGKDEKPDLTQTYLRITLGSHMVNSPGIPYVLEIWPAGHYSPVHEHADSFAIIKVLYGTIHAFFYDSLVNPGGPRMIMDKVELKTGDITWISPQHYQVHQLKNLSKRKEEGGEGTVCCTLQCYQYAYNDTIHYENFRYIPNSNSSVNSPTSTSTTSSSPNDSGYDSSSSSSDPDMMDFQPNSDMSFGVFKAAIRREWEEYMATDLGRKEEREFRAREKARGVEMGRTLGGVAAAIKGGEGEGLGGVSEVARKAAEMAEVLAGRERMVGMGMDGGSMEARAEAGMMEVGE
ncbi:hypothetical protein C8J55DRAFT_221613 [Lentinula edodes]|uniref:Cysteine dioxygenase n=1 Tax=Lentinula lateritia TaxID=40482 RepID=A0A9W9AXZ8_9AGAR|nr:hypothetical protein C8J55DRAFT_221613 [Lentinula edodes]